MPDGLYIIGPREEDTTDPNMLEEDVEQFNRQERVRAERPDEDFEFDLLGRKIHAASLANIATCVSAQWSQKYLKAPLLVSMMTLVFDCLVCLPGSNGSEHQIAWLVQRSEFVSTDGGEKFLRH